MTDIFNLFQSISQLIENQRLENILVSKKEDYNLNKNSYFLDIGSGFGKPVFHAAYQVGCESMGIEVVPARVEFCWDFYYEFLIKGDFFNGLNKSISLNDSNSISSMSTKSLSENNSLGTIEVFSLSSLNGDYYKEIFDSENILEYDINKDLVTDDVYAEHILSSNRNKINGIIILDPPDLKFGEYFPNTNLELKSNQKLKNSLKISILKNISSYTNDYEDQVDLLFYNEYVNHTKFLNLLKKVNNLKVLDFLLFSNIIFNKNYFKETLNRMSYLEYKNYLYFKKKSFFSHMNTVNFLKARKKIEKNHISKQEKINQIEKLENEFIIANNISELPFELKSKLFTLNFVR